MDIRKDPLVNDHYYHVFSRSIAKYVIFNDEEDYLRFMELLNLYRFADFNYKYSKFISLEISHQKGIIENLQKTNNFLVKIISFCLMPTHIHLLLKQNSDDGISKFMSRILNSYTRYFNIKHGRKGPLYEGPFKSVLVKTDEQLLHLTRYHHLNPSSAGIVNNPFDWPYSSLREYCDEGENGFCDFRELINMLPKQYKKFVLDQKSYQRELSIIKEFLIDNYGD